MEFQKNRVNNSPRDTHARIFAPDKHFTVKKGTGFMTSNEELGFAKYYAKFENRSIYLPNCKQESVRRRRLILLCNKQQISILQTIQHARNFHTST